MHSQQASATVGLAEAVSNSRECMHYWQPAEAMLAKNICHDLQQKKINACPKLFDFAETDTQPLG